MSNGKVMIIHEIVGLIKKTLYKMSQYLPKPYKPFGADINFKVDLSSYTTNIDLKNATGVDTSKLAAKSDVVCLKTKVDKIDFYKLRTVPVDLSKLSNVVKNNDVVKKTVYDKLSAKVNNIDSSKFVLKAKYDTDKSNLEKKISDADKKIPVNSRLVKKTDYDAKITETEIRILSISDLDANAGLTGVESKIIDISSLLKKQILMKKY